MSVNIKSVPGSVKVASSVLIIIGLIDLFMKLYFRIGGLVDANDFIPYLLSLALSIGEVISGYAIFYRFRAGYIAGWVYAALELYVGIQSLMDYFDIGNVSMDRMYLGNLFVGIVVILALCRPAVYNYCFRKNEPAGQKVQ